MASVQHLTPQVAPELSAITAWLREPGNDHFLVTSHVNPDGDGLASMLACGRVLRSLGKQAWLVADGFLSPRYAYLPSVETVVPYRDGLEAELPVANVITVDVPTLSRLERVARLIPRHAAILKIDHHPSDDHFGRFNYVETEVSSTAELVYHLCAGLGIPFDAALGTWIYTGIAFTPGVFGSPRPRQTPCASPVKWCAPAPTRSSSRSSSFTSIAPRRCPSWPRRCSPLNASSTGDWPSWRWIIRS